MPQDKNAEQTEKLEKAEKENAELRARLDAIEARLAGAPATPAESKKHVPVWKRHRVRVTGRGAANNRTYEPGIGPQEFELVLDSAATPASWYEKLDEGVPSKAPNTAHGAYDFAKAEKKPDTDTGFAAGQPGSVL